MGKCGGSSCSLSKVLGILKQKTTASVLFLAIAKIWLSQTLGVSKTQRNCSKKQKRFINQNDGAANSIYKTLE